MALSWWGKGLWQIYMHHWTVHAKVDVHQMSDPGGSILQLFILNSEMNSKFFSIWEGSIPQFLILICEIKDLHWYPLWISCNIKYIIAISNLHFQYRWVPLKPDFLGAWKSVWLKHYPAYPIIIISLIIQRNLATKIQAKWESGLTAVWLKWDPPVENIVN